MGRTGRGHEDRLPVGVEALLHALHARTRDRARAADQRRRLEGPQARPAGDHQVRHLGSDVPLADHHEQAECRGAEGAAREARRQDRAHAGRHPEGRRWKPGTRSPRTESDKNPFFKKVYASQRAYASEVVPARRCCVSRLTRPAPTTTGPRRNDRDAQGPRGPRPFSVAGHRDGGLMQDLPASEPARRPSGRYLATIRAIDGITTWTALSVRAARHPADRRQRDRGVHALCHERPDVLGARRDDHVVRRAVHAGRRLRAAQGRACAHRHAVGELLRPQEGHHRQRRLRAVLSAVDGDPVRDLDR